MEFIPFAEGEAQLEWLGLLRALEAGHTLPKGHVHDSYLSHGEDQLLTRSAWVPGLGMAVKPVTIFAQNPEEGLPSHQGAVTLFSDMDGRLDAVIDFELVTKWKTAGDSLLAAQRLARPDSEAILLVGAGAVAQSAYEAYRALFPEAQFSVWNRSWARAESFMKANRGVRVETDLESAVKAADIVICCTMARQPLLRGEWLRPGTHVDLIGAHRSDMREADDAAIRKARIFTDNRELVLGNNGEFLLPIAAGVMKPEDIIADFYALEAFGRQSEEEITLFKNGGGAHLDLMTSRYILDAWRAE